MVVSKAHSKQSIYLWFNIVGNIVGNIRKCQNRNTIWTILMAILLEILANVVVI